MAAIKSRNTNPELEVRRILHALGYRFQLHRKDLPGHPDIVLPKYKTVVFVNGCFWHQHADCKLASKPSSNHDYWKAKLDRNIERDKENFAKLSELGWEVVIVWECELRNPDIISQYLRNRIK